MTERTSKTDHPSNILCGQCVSQDVLAMISDKWSILVLYTLKRDTMRYSKLQGAIGGITQKMLTQTLRNLERNGLIQRTVYPVVPPHVEYCRTELGQSLDFLLDGLCRWAEDQLPAVIEARARYDAADRIHASPLFIQQPSGH